MRRPQAASTGVGPDVVAASLAGATELGFMSKAVAVVALEFLLVVAVGGNVASFSTFVAHRLVVSGGTVSGLAPLTRV